MPMINVDPETPLHRAVRSQKVDLVKLLLKGGGDVDVRGMYV
jgi:ankyrin repeat protein